MDTTQSYKGISKPHYKRIVFLADVHFGVRVDSLEWLDNMSNYFYKFFIPYLETICTYGDVEDATTSDTAVIIAGDYFENRQHLDISIMNKGMDIMQRMAQVAPIYVMVGNHDIYKEKDIDINSLRVLSYMQNVTVIDELTQLTVNGGKSLFMIPWVGDRKQETAILKKYRESGDIFVMHSELSGMSFDNGRPITDGVDTDCIKDKILVAGHIHTRQERGHLIYVGSPYQTKRSDAGNAKGIYDFAFSDDGKIEMHFTENKYSPIFTRVKIIDYLETPVGDVEKILKNNYVDIVVPKVYKDDITSTKIMDVFGECGVKKIGIVLEKTSEVAVENETHTMGKENISIRTVFDQQIDAMGFEEKDKKELTRLNNGYISKAVEELNYTEEV